jgi:hypothetical protein
MTNLGSVSLGILLAQQAIQLDQAVAALTVTARQVAGPAHTAPGQQAQFTAEVSHSVQRLLRYVRLST